ncbi:zf-TFIIB domain-containing protein [Haloarchaeobius sp. HME9146]|uniref:TFIIB-type zinc ribbon-containing protein n=1 Tax=Haloarchaeobius sp. HME9146 TaxID=2978732 RepID=UPI0021C05D54|nr:zf-TFIIB domain-containing protein [Haloarchaeobius sp. HME9146]MCT9096518.1 zf-TFIIB domain-containing protein [Haloarchaeobius sp. HME9146]
MKECPRCGSSLSHYALSEVEAYGCDGCGWVGIDVEHRSEPVRIESWQDAISRFHQQFTDSELDDHAQNLNRVEAERRAAIGEDDATEAPEADDKADQPDGSEGEASVEDAAAEAVEESEETGEVDSDGATDAPDDDSDAQQEAAAPTNTQAE